jgi:peptide/nickel transport system ATP-binding protein/oligopeptide transport system ATP-binding protein
MSLLTVENLGVEYSTGTSKVLAVSGVSFKLDQGETLGIVGESGSGKTTIALALMRLLPKAAILSGKAIYAGRDIFKLDPQAVRTIRGREISLVFQDPLTSLNPVFTIGSQIIETLKEYYELNRREARTEALHLLTKVGLSNSEYLMHCYPHELSGGMLQRVLIAMALAGRPKLLIADEPTSSLDVTIQAQILELLNNLKRSFNLAILVISHDFGVISTLAEMVLVMCAGQVVEIGETREIFQNPLHPYTRGLIAAAFGKSGALWLTKKVNFREREKGCLFASICPEAVKTCFKEEPELKLNRTKHVVACHAVKTKF